MTKWHDTESAAEYTGFAAGTLENWRYAKPRKGPDFRRVGRAIRYDEAALDRFMNQGAEAA